MSRFTADLINWLRKRSPFVNQFELINLIRRDRVDIDKQLRLEQQIQRRPRRGVSPTPRRVINAWRDYVKWIDGMVTYLEQPRSTAELEKVVHEWQNRRRDIVTMKWRWNKRADVIPID